MPHRARAADLPHRRLGAVPRGQRSSFADAVVEEAHSDDPVVLVQDYHFALLPRMIRERLPKATIITFWHIPWPNPGVVRHLPVARGAARRHARQRHPRLSHAVPLQQLPRYRSTAWSRRASTARRSPWSAAAAAPRCTAIRSRSSGPRRRSLRVGRRSTSAGERVRVRLNLPRGHKLGIGIDRLDYTKGILERFNAVARLLELHPEWIGRFTFVQIAAPTRGKIDDYQDYASRVSEARGRDQRAVPAGRAPADHAAGRAPRAANRSTSITAPPTSASSAACTTG